MCSYLENVLVNCVLLSDSLIIVCMEKVFKTRSTFTAKFGVSRCAFCKLRSLQYAQRDTTNFALRRYSPRSPVNIKWNSSLKCLNKKCLVKP